MRRLRHGLVLAVPVLMVACGTGSPHTLGRSFADADRERAVRAAEYILACQEPGGAIRDAIDSTAVNMDNNMGYALAALAAAYRATGDGRYLEAVRRGLVWLASVQDSSGVWHWGYRAPAYLPFVGEQYRRAGITDIKGVDAIQAYFAYALDLYVRLSGDRALGEALLPAARRGVEYLLAYNYDGRFFYSSWQERGGEWVRLGAQFSAGQADVYLGLMGLYGLTGEPRYRDAAARVRTGLRAFQFAGVWATSRRNPLPYRFSNGYLPYVFHVRDGLAWLGTHQDGSAIAAASLAIGVQANGGRADGPLAALRALQGAHGGVAFSDRTPFTRYYYTNDTAFAILGWLGAAPIGFESGAPPAPAGP